VPNTDEKVIIKNPAEAKFGFGNTILYIFNFIFIVVNIIILGIAISYMTSSSTTTDTVSYSKNVTIGALVINLIIFFILLYMYFGEVWGFNSYVDTLTKKPPVPITPLGTQLFTLTTNPLYPGEIIKSDINVNYTYKEYPDYVTVNGQIVKNTSAPQEVTKNETFEYINPLYVKPPSVVTTPTVVTLTPTTTTTSTTNPTTIPTTTASTRVYT
jgi:heme/copper-type cytochrome/quinol oxidase subunit 2